MQYIVNTANKRVSGSSPKPAAQVSETKGAPKARTVTKKITQTAALTSEPVASKLVPEAINIMSEESGIEVTQLTDDCRFDDIGMDSLMSLMVCSKLRDQLEIDMDSSVFLELSTVGKLKTYLNGLDQGPHSVTLVETVDEEIVPLPPTEEITGDTNALWSSAVDIISEESGLGPESLSDDTTFSDIGIDSLLSLVICSRLRDELEVDLPDRALFSHCPTVGQLRNHVTGSPPDTTPDESNGSESDTPISPMSKSHSSTPVNEGTATPASEISSSTTQKRPAANVRRDSAFATGIVDDASIKAAWSVVAMRRWSGSTRDADQPR